jgi:multiple sugar transport system substrate-binding protein
MSRPESESEYLDGLVPPSVRATVGRRSFLRGAVTAGAALGAPGLLAACGGGQSGGSGSGGGGKAGGTVTFGSNASDPVPRKTLGSILTSAKGTAGVTVKVNTVDHNTFQENINNYLQGRPDDVFTWFAGFRMRFFAANGLAGDITDVWGKVGGDFSEAFKKASTGDDGKQYFVPLYNYPWVVNYRKSVFQKNGYQVPKTLDELTALMQKMKKDGLVPMAFADKDGWPAMGTFDILNMRINGYQFHVDLMAGKEAWDSAKVKKVFDTWRRLMPYHQPASLGRIWQEAAQSLQQKKAGMYLLGSFVAQQITGPDQADLDFFNFPEVDSTVGADALDAPIDGFMMSKKPRNENGAKALLQYLGSPAAGQAYTKADPSVVAANQKADTSGYTPLQKKSAEIIGNAKSIAQFLDRDTRPDFASTVMIPALQSFIKNPNDIDGLTKSIEQQKKSIFV